MKQSKKIIILTAILVLASCAGKNDKDEAGDVALAKLEHTPEKNPVDVIVLQEKDFNKQLPGNGKLYARQKSVLSFNSSGKIAEINVGNGSHVNKGDVIASLNREDAEASYKQAGQSLEKAEIDFYSALIGFGYTARDTVSVPKDILYSVKLSSGYASALVNMDNASRALKNIDLRAPFSGKIASIKSRPYENASGEFCTIVNDAVLDTEFSVLESEVGFVKTGQRIKVATFTEPDKFIEGYITQVNPMVDEKGHIKITGEIKNDGTLIDGMNIKVLIEETIPNQLVVPKDAVRIRDNLEVLFRARNGRAVWTYVNTTMSNTNSYVVKANIERQADLNVGDTVIISGNLNLADGSYIEVKP